ncbi:MAG: hypothetical protein HQM09_17275 [Candidatus Riflebacteria bacterium]|nr:hypothetical protein [Candidatus Riflebacteria bacterium]
MNIRTINLAVFVVVLTLGMSPAVPAQAPLAENFVWPETVASNSNCLASFRSLAEMKIPLFISGGQPKVLSLERVTGHDNLWLLKYYSGCVGTSQCFDIYRAIILNMESKTILGDFEYMVKDISGRSTQQPAWKWSKKLLVVVDSQGEKHILNLPQKKPVTPSKKMDTTKHHQDTATTH